MDDYVDLRFAGGGKFGLGWLMGLVIRQGEMGFPFSHVAFLEKDWTSCIGARAEGGVQRRGVDADAEGATAFLVARIRCSAAQARLARTSGKPHRPALRHAGDQRRGGERAHRRAAAVGG